MIAFVNCAASDANDMSLGWGLSQPDGYFKLRKVVDGILERKPDSDVMLHLPFGRPRKLVDGKWKAEHVMELTTVFDAVQRGYKHLRSTFVDAWQGLPNELIVYLGSPQHDRRVNAMLYKRLDRVLQVISIALEKPLAVGASIAFDTLGGVDVSGFALDIAEVVERLVPVYQEPIPPKNKTWNIPAGSIISHDRFVSHHEQQKTVAIAEQWAAVGSPYFKPDQVTVIITPTDMTGLTLEQAAKRIQEIEGYGCRVACQITLFEMLLAKGYI